MTDATDAFRKSKAIHDAARDRDDALKARRKAADAVATAEARAALRGGLPWEHGGREIQREKRRLARQPKARPGQALASRRYRERVRASKAEHEAAAAAAAPPVVLDRAVLLRELRAMITWLRISAPRQRKLKAVRVGLWQSRKLFLTMRAELGAGIEPGPTEFARRLTKNGMKTDRRRAHERIKIFATMEARAVPVQVGS